MNKNWKKKKKRHPRLYRRLSYDLTNLYHLCYHILSTENPIIVTHIMFDQTTTSMVLVRIPIALSMFFFCFIPFHNDDWSRTCDIIKLIHRNVIFWLCFRVYGFQLVSTKMENYIRRKYKDKTIEKSYIFIVFFVRPKDVQMCTKTWRTFIDLMRLPRREILTIFLTIISVKNWNSFENDKVNKCFVIRPLNILRVKLTDNVL